MPNSPASRNHIVDSDPLPASAGRRSSRVDPIDSAALAIKIRMITDFQFDERPRADRRRDDSANSLGGVAEGAARRSNISGKARMARIGREALGDTDRTHRTIPFGPRDDKVASKSHSTMRKDS